MSFFNELTNIVIQGLIGLSDSWIFLVTFYVICILLRKYYSSTVTENELSKNFAVIAAGALGTFLSIFYSFGG